MSRFAPHLAPPYHAVIFTSLRRDGATEDGYDAMAEEMAQRAARQPGYLGHESSRDVDGFGITVSYWRDAKAVSGWKQEARHLLAQRLGRDRWYHHYVLRVACVERAYDGPEGR
ncbi:antibiotic biosynthesis monooxygenase [Thioclava sp. BHET1]|nr:antibiotic biosynthesis monooxygenase [Thioclava sp. BHET1]